MIQNQYKAPGRALLAVLLAASFVFAFCGKPAGPSPEASKPEKPAVESIGVVSPNIVSITIRAGRVEYGRQEPYSQRKDDRVVTGEEGTFWVFRGTKMVGALIRKEGKMISLDGVVGERPEPALFDRPEGYVLSSADDASYAAPKSPETVFRKSKPTDLACMGGTFDAPVEHTVYLKLADPLKPGKKYSVRLPVPGVPEQAFVYDPARTISEAVHVSQVGFRPDDPSKTAFLSLWMGSGGAYAFREGTPFSVIDDVSNAVQFRGGIKLTKRGGDPTEDTYGRNFSGVDVYIADFSALAKPGTYRVCVEGVGCSHSFDIRDDVWQKAFYISVRGLYHQRSGIELGPPYTSFRRPRNFHPDDGVRIYASKATLMDTSNGLEAKNDSFTKLVQGRTDDIVPNAWGGYCDAGDWDRRIQHIAVSRMLLELYELFPDYFERLDLNLPGPDGLPGILREALWDIDFYRRLQTKEGGVRGGIESEAHPRYGEASWQESQLVMAYAPDAWSSYEYAAAAAAAAYTLKTRSPALSKEYGESALSAMTWAERELGTRVRWPDPVKESRGLAAAELLRLTGAKSWRDIFLAAIDLSGPDRPKTSGQMEAAWVCIRSGTQSAIDNGLKARCRENIIKEAGRRMNAQQQAGFRWMKDPYRPPLAGAFTVSDSINVLRAHYMTGDAKYLKAAVLACQAGAGANPLNMSYTTGLGWKSPLHPMHFDSRVTNQAPPPGITVLGPLDISLVGGFDSEPYRTLARYCYPESRQWPVLETYWDVYWYPIMCEFTVHQTIGPNAYAWGYLAARKGSHP